MRNFKHHCILFGIWLLYLYSLVYLTLCGQYGADTFCENGTGEDEARDYEAKRLDMTTKP